MPIQIDPADSEFPIVPAPGSAPVMNPPVTVDNIIKQVAQDRLTSDPGILQSLLDLSNNLQAATNGKTYPSKLRGQLLARDAGPMRRVLVTALPPDPPPAAAVQPGPAPGAFSSSDWNAYSDLTDDRGVFAVTLPRMAFPPAAYQSVLKLRVLGRQGGGTVHTDFSLSQRQIEGGDLGVYLLDAASPILEPLFDKTLAGLESVYPTGSSDAALNAADFATPAPQVSLGSDDGGCQTTFRSNSGVVEAFPYSVVFRLSTPGVSPRRLTLKGQAGTAYYQHARPPQVLITDGAEADRLQMEKAALTNFDAAGTWSTSDRVPIDEPLDIDSFRQAVETNAARIPKTSTLSVGYLVLLEQVWLPAGYSLGDLVYSLPLAPAEQQKVAVFDQVQTFASLDSESAESSQRQTFDETSDSSALSTFNSALRTAASGGSSFRTASDSLATGDSGGILGAIFGGSNSSAGHSSSTGGSSSFQTGSKTFVSRAAEDLHSNLGQVASDLRQSNRTVVRTANASDSEQVTTKVITNNNHCHALTVQYWEVLRHFSVSSRVKDVQLVCFVPFNLIPFLPPDAPSPSPAMTLADILKRYAVLIRYREAILSELFTDSSVRYAFDALESLFAGPQNVAAPVKGGKNEVSITFAGNFTPGEEVTVSMFTKGGASYGPTQASLAQGTTFTAPRPASPTQAQLITWLMNLRDHSVVLGAVFPMPTNLTAADILGFQISRNSSRSEIYIDTSSSSAAGAQPTQSVKSFSPNDQEELIGAPVVSGFSATLDGVSVVQSRTVGTLQGSLTVPADPPTSISPSDIAKIERVLQFVVRNGVRFSKAVWTYLSPEERAMLLEPYTVEFTSSNPQIALQASLLDCVSNNALGFLGNSIIVPFYIPAVVENADALKDKHLSSKRLQDLLLEFHTQTFVAPSSSITLPTHGVLAEAMLGSCNSCEKIDLTRFWNWSDSPIPQAVDPTLSTFKGNQLIAQAPTTATTPPSPGLPPISLTNIGAHNGASSQANLADLLKAALTSVGSDSNKDLTGAQFLESLQSKTIDTAEAARKDALAQSNALAKEVIDKLTEIIKSGNETAAKVAPEIAKAAAVG